MTERIFPHREESEETSEQRLLRLYKEALNAARADEFEKAQELLAQCQELVEQGVIVESDEAQQVLIEIDEELERSTQEYSQNFASGLARYLEIFQQIKNTAPTSGGTSSGHNTSRRRGYY